MTGKVKLLIAVGILICYALAGCAKKESLIPVKPEVVVPVDSVTVAENKVDRNELLTLVNGLRSRGCDCGSTKMPPVHTLKWSGSLEKAAWLHSKDMKVSNFFQHNSLDGTTPGTRITAVGYNWYTYGENIAKGNMDEQAVILGWLSSPEHCKNMMKADYYEVGIGKEGLYWTMDLGSRVVGK